MSSENDPKHVNTNIKQKVLRDLMLQQGMDIRLVARRAKVGESTLHKWLGPDPPANPGYGPLKKVADVLGVQVDDLVFRPHQESGGPSGYYEQAQQTINQVKKALAAGKQRPGDNDEYLGVVEQLRRSQENLIAHNKNVTSYFQQLLSMVGSLRDSLQQMMDQGKSMQADNKDFIELLKQKDADKRTERAQLHETARRKILSDSISQLLRDHPSGMPQDVEREFRRLVEELRRPMKD